MSESPQRYEFVVIGMADTMEVVPNLGLHEAFELWLSRLRASKAEATASSYHYQLELFREEKEGVTTITDGRLVLGTGHPPDTAEGHDSNRREEHDGSYMRIVQTSTNVENLHRTFIQWVEDIEVLCQPLGVDAGVELVSTSDEEVNPR